jgi:hypothetical protein
MALAIVPRLVLGRCFAALLALVPLAHAQVDAVNKNWTEPAYYVVSPLTPNCLETYYYFAPTTGTAPYPVLIHFDMAGFYQTNKIDTLPVGDWRIGLLNKGIAVITARGSVSLPASWQQYCGLPLPPGHGLFHPPNYPCGSVTPYNNGAYPMAEKDATMLIQHVRFYAGTDDPLLHNVDGHRIIVHGVSAGAIALMWPTFGPERYGVEPFKGLGGQYDMPARPDAAVLRLGAIWWPIFDLEYSNPPNGTIHFALPHDESTVAPSLEDVDPVEIVEASALWYDDVMLNPSLPTLLVYGDPSHCTDYEKHPSSECDPPPPAPSYPYPICFHGAGQEGPPQLTVHPSWSGLMWTTLYGQNGYGQYGGQTKLLITGEIAAYVNYTWTNQTPLAMQNVAAFKILPTDPPPTVDDQVVSWIDDNSLPKPWIPIHYAKEGNLTTNPAQRVGVAGTHGIPLLEGSGTPTSPGSITLTLSGAKENAAAYVFVGVGDLLPPYGHPNSKFKGGLFVPDIDFLQPLATNGSGGWSGTGPLPAGLSPFRKIYFQVWVSDPAAPYGAAGSNALQATIQ